MSSEPVVQDLQLSNRMYILNRNVAGIIDCGVELITNSDDAYNRMAVAPSEKMLYVTVDHYRHEFAVTDNATGMGGDELIEKMGTVGAYTSTESSRGYFSRGAKDIASIGNVVYTSVKDGLLSQVELTHSLTMIIHKKDVPVTDEQRAELRIPVNGVNALVKVLSVVSIPDIDHTLSIIRYFSLRAIFSNPSNHVNFKIVDKQGGVYLDQRVRYEAPELMPSKPPLIDTEFRIETWPDDCVCRLVVHELEEYQDLSNATIRECGVLVRTKTAIHANESFFMDLEMIPSFRKITGVLHCDYLDVLMKELEQDKLTDRNVFPCINSDRTGLNKRHPFVKDLYRQVYRMLKYVLTSEFRKTIASNIALMDITDILTAVGTPDLMYFSAQASGPVRTVTTEQEAERTVNFLKKSTDNIVSKNDDAVYNFDSESQFAVDDMTNGGNAGPIQSKLQVRIADEAGFDTPSRHFTIDSTFIVEVNAGDAIVKTCVSKISDDVFEVTNHQLFVAITARFVAGALAETVVDEMLTRFAEDELKRLTDANKRMRINQMTFQILPGIFAMLQSSDTFEDMITNDL